MFFIINSLISIHKNVILSCVQLVFVWLFPANPPQAALLALALVTVALSAPATGAHAAWPLPYAGWPAAHAAWPAAHAAWPLPYAGWPAAHA